MKTLEFFIPAWLRATQRFDEWGRVFIDPGDWALFTRIKRLEIKRTGLFRFDPVSLTLSLEMGFLFYLGFFYVVLDFSEKFGRSV